MYYTIPTIEKQISSNFWICGGGDQVRSYWGCTTTNDSKALRKTFHGALRMSGQGRFESSLQPVRLETLIRVRVILYGSKYS